MNIGSTIKELRKKKNYNQDEFGELCGISQTSLSQIETGSTRPHQNTLDRICEVLGISVHLLYLMSMSESDVTEDRKEVYQQMFPTIKKLMLNLYGIDSNGKAQS